jgi:solute carrier family 35 protein C2
MLSSTKTFYEEHCLYLPYMSGWFFFSSLLSGYNKVVFGNSYMAFPCPLLLTSIHFLVQWMFSFIMTRTWSDFGGDTVQSMSWKAFFLVSVPCGFVAAGDIGLSNLALVRITITFYTMVKASTPIFVVISASLFRIETITTSLLIVVLIISAGEFLTVMGEVNFDLIGFVLCICASIFSGMRWTIIQLKLQTLEPPLKTALATMRVLSPTMFFLMLIMSLVWEKPWSAFNGTAYFDTVLHSFQTMGLALAGATIAICMILCELHLIIKSSAFIMMIGGVVKEMCTVSMGYGRKKIMLLFHLVLPFYFFVYF